MYIVIHIYIYRYYLHTRLIIVIIKMYRYPHSYPMISMRSSIHRQLQRPRYVAPAGEIHRSTFCGGHPCSAVPQKSEIEPRGALENRI